MSNEGVLSEFDPLTVAKSTPRQPASQDKEKETTAEISTKSLSVLGEFDPLTRQGEADKGQTSHSIKQGSTALVHSAQSTLTMATSTSQSNGNTSPHKPTQSHTGGYQNGSSKQLGSTCKINQSNIIKGGDMTTTAVPQSAVSETSKSDRIGAEISQIDSVLKALNMRQFDLTTMSSLTAKSQSREKPQTREKLQPKQVRV